MTLSKNTPFILVTAVNTVLAFCFAASFFTSASSPAFTIMAVFTTITAVGGWEIIRDDYKKAKVTPQSSSYSSVSEVSSQRKA